MHVEMHLVAEASRSQGKTRTMPAKQNRSEQRPSLQINLSLILIYSYLLHISCSAIIHDFQTFSFSTASYIDLSPGYWVNRQGRLLMLIICAL